MRRRSPILPVLPAMVALGLSACGDRHAPRPLVVFAAASTTEVMQEAARRFEAQTGTPVVLSLGASSDLARQIRAGAPADVYVSADQAWMDYVDAAGAIATGTRRDVLANGLVLVAPAGAGLAVRFDAAEPAQALPGVRRLAVADPGHVPAGRYAREALQALGWWEALQPLLIPARDVRAALRLVEIGEAGAGIVYATDAVRSGRVEVVAALPAQLHTPIHYPAALSAKSTAGAAFLELLAGPEMQRFCAEAGFQPVPALHGDAG